MPKQTYRLTPVFSLTRNRKGVTTFAVFSILIGTFHKLKTPAISL